MPHSFFRCTSLSAISLGLVLMVAVHSVALAEKSDKNKPMVGEADSLRHDALKQTDVFSGNVVITKGSIIMRGAQVAVRQDPEGFQYGSITAVPGKLAFYRQKRDVPDEWIEGEADTIQYDGRADSVTFTKNAVLRRYKGTTVSDEISGNVITYDNTTDVFSVVGGAANASATNPTGRIRAVLSPKDNSAKAATPAPAATLRPTTNLGGPSK